MQLTPIQTIGRLGLVDGSQIPRYRLRNSVIVLTRIVYRGTFRAEFHRRSLNGSDELHPCVTSGNQENCDQAKNQFLKNIRTPCSSTFQMNTCRLPLNPSTFILKEISLTVVSKLVRGSLPLGSESRVGSCGQGYPPRTCAP